MKPLMTIDQLAEHLRANGFPIATRTLGQYVKPCINTGPPVAQRWGRRPLFDPDAALAWAHSRLNPGQSGEQEQAA
jgi:hypothetical protein